MPKLWKLFGNSSSPLKTNNNKNDRNTNSNTNIINNIDNNNNDNNNEISRIIELNNHKKDGKSIIQEENENINSENPSSLIHNKLMQQEYVELQKGITKEVVRLGNSEPKDVLMKVDLLGVHILDKENPKTLLQDFEVEQIIQYSYERDKQYLTLSYMNSDFSVESYDFVTPDYFEIFDFIGHVIAMVIKMNNQKYETEEEANDSDDLNNFQLPKISSIYKSTESINIFSPTFILNNFIPENNTTSEGYLNNCREDINNSSSYIPNKETIPESIINDKNIFNSNKELKGSVEDIGKKRNKTNIEKFIEMNNNTECSSSTPNLLINTNTHSFENEFRRNYNIIGSKSAIEGKTSLSDAFGFDRDSRVLGYKKLGVDNGSTENFDKRSSNQCRTVRHINSGKFDISEIPAYGKKYGTIHFRKSHDFDEIYTSELILNSDSMKDQADKNNEDSNNQTQSKVNIMKYFSENRYSVDKKKSYSIGILTDNKDENENNKLYKPGKLKGKDSEDDFSINIDSSKDTIETTNEDDKKKNKNKIQISEININKTSEEYSPSVISLDENESPQKNVSLKKLKLKYNFYRPKSLQLNFLSSNKDSSKKRISIKNLSDCNDIGSPSPIDGENNPDIEKMSKNQQRKSNIRKSKKSFLLSKKLDANEEQEKQNSTINENEIISEEDPESNKKKDKSSNTIQYYNAFTDEIEEKPIDDVKYSLHELPKLPSSSSEVGSQGGKNELDLLSSYIEAYSSSPGSKIYSTAVSTIKSQNDSRLSKTYPKELINSLNDSMFSPISNESNFDYFVNETNSKNNKESPTITSLENDDQQDSKSQYHKKVRSVSDMKNNTMDNKFISNIRSMNYSYKSEDILNLDLNIIKDQNKYSTIKSASCINDGLNDRNINQNEDIVANNQHQQLHKYKNKQVINYRTIHGVSPFVSQGNNSAMLSCYNQLNSDRNSNKGKQSHNDIYSTLKKFVGKNQKTKTSINEINFVDGAPDSEENELPQIEKEYEDGKECLIRTLKDNHYEVTAGTVHSLINEMILNNTTDIMFIDIFLLTYRHFLKANDLVLLLTDEYNKLIKMVDESENNESNNDVNLQIQKVASVIKKWVADYFNDFLMSKDALTNLNILVDKMKNDKAKCKTYVDQINSLIKYGIKESEEEKKDELEIPDKNKNLTYDIDLVDILSIPSKKVAQQLTLVDSILWRSIESQEYAHFLWDSKDVKEKNTKNIQRFIERFNQISFWVSTMICKTQTLKSRTNVLEKMIKIAKCCLEIQNFNTTMAILSGLNMAAVSRLKGLWMSLSSKTMNLYAEIEKTMSYKCNFKNYRDLEYNSKPPLIPFFGLFLKDLTFMNDGNQKILKNELINFQKLRIIYTKIKSVIIIQKELFGFQPDNTIMETTKLNPTESNSENIVKHEIEMFEYFKILPHYTEMTLLELSKKIEYSHSKVFNTIMIAKPTPPKKLSETTEKSNTSKNPSLIELFQQ